MVIGSMGCKAAPDDQGMVEIGYDIVPAYQGQGYATEMARAFVKWALDQALVRRVAAECLPDNWASIRVLEKLGMQRVAEHEDMLYWEFPIGE
jgi:ribosomal-protein-alanine N-acetyltransferase